jgi:hypothetical protein
LSINTTQFAREYLETLVQQWVHTTHPVDVERVDFTFMPDPHAENWMENAILSGQHGLASLHLQALFGLSVPLIETIGGGDVLCDQFTKSGRVRVLHIHDDPFGWTDGGDPDLDPAAADAFVHQWREHPALDAICCAVRQAPERAIDALDGELRPFAERILTTYRQLVSAEGGRLPDIHGARALNDTIQCLLPAMVRTAPRGLVGMLDSATWIAVSLTRGATFPSEEQIAGLGESIDQLIADPSAFGPANHLRLLWGSYFLEKRVAEMLAIAPSSPWRIIADSARLIERLVHDPVLGSMTLVTHSRRRR